MTENASARIIDVLKQILEQCPTYKTLFSDNASVFNSNDLKQFLVINGTCSRQIVYKSVRQIVWYPERMNSPVAPSIRTLLFKKTLTEVIFSKI